MAVEQFIVGFVRGSHGVSGEFKVESASGYYEHLVDLKEVTLRNGTQEKQFKVEYANLAGQTLYMKLAEINSIEEVQKYNKWELIVPRKYAHKLQKDEWYFEDLKDCSLIWNKNSTNKNKNGTADDTASTQVVGTITDVLEGGAGYLLEVSISESCTVLEENLKFTSSGKQRKVLIPFNYHYVSNIDVKNKTIQLMHLWILE